MCIRDSVIHGIRGSRVRKIHLKQRLDGIDAEARLRMIPVSYTHLDVYKRQNLDTYERIYEEDVREGAVEIASAVYALCLLYTSRCV